MNRLPLVICCLISLFGVDCMAKVLPRPLPPVISAPDRRADEKPIQIEHTSAVIEKNPYFQKVKTTFTFTNPNARAMTGALEFPIPEDAIVCGYALEINGEMVPGVICPKAKARVAFENEQRKGVDPGLVEHVKGNVWRTRIYPLMPNTPRKAEVEYICQRTDIKHFFATPLEQDGTDFFYATAAEATQTVTIETQIAAFSTGILLWDASLSAQPHAEKWIAKVAALPEKGEWKLILFRNEIEPYEAPFTTKTALLDALKKVVYDGGTNLTLALNAVPKGTPTLLFTDELDTLSLTTPTLESVPNLILSGRDTPPTHAIEIRKLSAEEAVKLTEKPTQSTLLATIWAARRMQALAGQADAHQTEFIALGRRYGVAGPGLSLIVLERLDQWLTYDIEPPSSLRLHAEWVKQRAQKDDAIAAKRAQMEHEERLLRYWEERVKWWNDPKPPKRTPSSGLFDTAEQNADTISADGATPVVFGARQALNATTAETIAAPSATRKHRIAAKRGDASNDTEAASPIVTLKAWDPTMPYLEALKTAPAEKSYATYLQQRTTYAASPAFYLDCAGWFLKQDQTTLGLRIISNLAEFKLKNAALWRTMGWRLREAGEYQAAIHCFRKVLAMREEEGQSHRDLALVLAEYGKQLAKQPPLLKESVPLLTEALQHFHTAAFQRAARRSGRRGNDFQVAVLALEELNGLIGWIEAHPWKELTPPIVPAFDAVYRRDLPVKLRIVMSWDTDETDIDLHVLEPNGEEAYYGNRRTSEGGFVSEDVTTGYGPEEYLKKDLESGTYEVLCHYFASRQADLVGATIVTATLYTDWGTAAETQQCLTLRLEKPKSKQSIGKVTLE